MNPEIGVVPGIFWIVTVHSTVPSWRRNGTIFMNNTNSFSLSLGLDICSIRPWIQHLLCSFHSLSLSEPWDRQGREAKLWSTKSSKSARTVLQNWFYNISLQHTSVSLSKIEKSLGTLSLCLLPYWWWHLVLLNVPY